MTDQTLTCQSTGDSLAKYFPPPTQFLRSLRKWLRNEFGKDFVNKGDCMLHGVQVDSYSCGIITTNTIDCAATGAHVWKPKHSIWESVRWFV